MTYGSAPFCLYRVNGETMLVTGTITRTHLLDAMPRPMGLPVISMVPYAQIRERGYMARDGGDAIISLVATDIRPVNVDEIPDDGRRFESPIRFEITDDEFAADIERVIRDEIGRGEGSNFLLSRRARARIDGFSPQVAATIFRRLVKSEVGAYMTFAFYDGERFFIGASPEQQLKVSGGVATMNPISGTLPKSRLGTRDDLIRFLKDPKEVFELFQVVDEELKMMGRICPFGATVKGPSLKEMGSLLHTEYFLEGKTDMDPVDAFRASMFPATMVGSPLENAARVVAKYEPESRGYYSSAIIVSGLDSTGRQTLDSAITIRTMQIAANGDVLLQSGSSIVRDSDPAKEVEETHSKIAGSLRAIASAEPAPVILPNFVDGEVRQALVDRNRTLSRFWTSSQERRTLTSVDRETSILVIDNEDEFTLMLGNVLRKLGYDVEIVKWSDPRARSRQADLVLVGPGPGDPTNLADPKIKTNHEIVRELLASDQRFFAVCLGHQIVSINLGLDIRQVSPPLQGVQKEVDFFGSPELVGFYNSFFAQRPDSPIAGLEVAADENGNVVAIRGDRFFGTQFHIESLLTRNNEAMLRQELGAILATDITVGTRSSNVSPSALAGPGA